MCVTLDCTSSSDVKTIFTGENNFHLRKVRHFQDTVYMPKCEELCEWWITGLKQECSVSLMFSNIVEPIYIRAHIQTPIIILYTSIVKSANSTCWICWTLNYNALCLYNDDHCNTTSASPPFAVWSAPFLLLCSCHWASLDVDNCNIFAISSKPFSDAMSSAVFLSCMAQITNWHQ